MDCFLFAPSLLSLSLSLFNARCVSYAICGLLRFACCSGLVIPCGFFSFFLFGYAFSLAIC